ncbi:MAG TPA: acetylxylan esterase [Tepidisphaeraceae bacterium]|nr:acetylxylan esterase [Tepidisphaeraceae bacterium]
MRIDEKTFTYSRLLVLFLLVISTISGATRVSLPTNNLLVTPWKKTAIYGLGDKIGWNIELKTGTRSSGQFTYTVKTNNFAVIKSGQIDLSSGHAAIETSVDGPAMVYLEIRPPQGAPIVAGAAVAPKELRPVVARPADFDSFWASKIKMLEKIPANSMLTPKDSGNPNIEYATIRMDHINGTHVYGQIARPKNGKRFPALVIFQWASPPYPLEKSWVTGPASQGWLVLNIEPHDVLPDAPQSYYAALPDRIKNYQTIGEDNRDESYFLQMYLADYRAVDYIASRPDWDGKTLVVMGTSMGGQQALCVAGLNKKVTDVIVNEPAGCDTNGPLHGRQSSYPNFPSDNPQIMLTSLYFDPINFAPNITVPTLVAMGFVDTTAAPAGIWTAFNEIKGPKEAVPMIDSPHNNFATAAEQEPFMRRSAEWLKVLAHGGHVPPENAFDDHQNMMDQVGVGALRPGPDPNNPAIYDEATANRYKNSMPDALRMNDGTEVTRADQWPKRRAEIVEDFERYIYGRIPPNVPTVSWKVINTKQGQSGDVPTITKELIGRADNSADPQIEVNIHASFTVPASATTPVPMMLSFDSGFHFRRRHPLPGIPWTQQAIEKGWGYGAIDPTSIQPDNDQLTSGIIGLTNHGRPRTPEQWGTLRAWQWGVSQLIDYFQAHSDSMVDPAKVGIEGVSRYGKAAIVTEAFDQRVAVGLIASSGEGGAKLYRHIFGEGVENLAGGEYYWMAGNFIKYGSADPLVTPAELPVDSHELIALCAPRPCFISYGVPEHGDPKWVDAHGSFMAAVLASPVYKLLGAEGLGISESYLTVSMPPVGKLIGGQLAWRQHDGGHDVTPNWPAFFQWVGQYVHS